MDTTPIKPIPKHSCMITVMFVIESDEQAIAVKKEIDKAVANIEEKRYTFQIDER